MNCSEIPEPGFKFAPGAKLLPAEAIQAPTRVQEAGGEEVSFRLYRELADLPVVARFTIEGEPASKARARFTKTGHAYTPAATRTAEERIAGSFRIAAPGYEPGSEITYGVMAVFFCGKRQRRDTDNMLKLILDGLNEVAWKDDSQVAEVSGRKTLVSPPDARTEIVIYTVGQIQYFFFECLNCGSEFASYPSWMAPQRLKKFCTPECAHTYRREMNRRLCSECGGTFYRGDRPKSKYCSTACGKKNQGRRPRGKK